MTRIAICDDDIDVCGYIKELLQAKYAEEVSIIVYNSAEELEKDYAQIVSKFTMLLSAGLSVRNAWERIVIMQRRKGISEKIIDEELRWGLREMQKGIPEMSVYERFGQRVGEVHFKKLMALFISDKKRGTLPLLDAMNQEMLCAWEEQKRKTRQQGEKIGTKLLLPMMGMLSVVFLIVLIPAFFARSNA